MGTALANAIQSKGHDLVVWNRLSDKKKRFKDMGVDCAADLSSAIKASPIAVICLALQLHWHCQNKMA